MDKVKHSRLAPILLTLLGFFLLLFGLLMNSWLGMLFKPPKWAYVLNLLPGVLFVIAAGFFKKIGRRRSLILMGSCAPWVVILVGLFFVNGAIGFTWSVRPETDVTSYRDVLSVLGYPESRWLQHFPQTIPENARSVSFYWNKGFLQSGVAIQLRCELPANEIRSLLIECRAKVQSLSPSVSKNKDRHAAKGPFTLLCAGETEPRKWPQDFEILLLCPDREADNRTETFSYGVAVRVDRNEVVYWAEEMDW